jgi:hypothetical protein
MCATAAAARVATAAARPTVPKCTTSAVCAVRHLRERVCAMMSIVSAGGTNACLDCAGAVNGTAIYDVCDTCVEVSVDVCCM